MVATLDPILHAVGILIMVTVNRGHRLMRCGPHGPFDVYVTFDDSPGIGPPVAPGLVFGILELMRRHAERLGILGTLSSVQDATEGEYWEFRPREASREELIAEAGQVIKSVNDEVKGRIENGGIMHISW